MKIITFGLKWGEPPKCDGTLDVRWARNPHRKKKLRYLSGLDPLVQADMAGVKDIQKAIDDVVAAFTPTPTDFTLGIFCTGGRHRSVYIGQKVAEALGCEVEHRDIHKGRKHD